MERKLCSDCKYYDDQHIKCPYKDSKEDEKCFRETIQNTMHKNKVIYFGNYDEVHFMLKYTKNIMIETLRDYKNYYKVVPEWLMYIFSKPMKNLEIYIKDGYLEYDNDLDDFYLLNKAKIERGSKEKCIFRGEEFDKLEYLSRNYVKINFKENKIIYTIDGFTNNLKIKFQKLYDGHKIVSQETTETFTKILKSLLKE